MQNANKINLHEQKFPHLINEANKHLTTLQKVKALESEHHSNFSLLKKFLQELQSGNDNSLWMYNREVI
jgi:hypothetical protein